MEDERIILNEEYNFWVPRKVSILGTEYTIRLVHVSTEKDTDKTALEMYDRSCVGLCLYSEKEILIADLTDQDYVGCAKYTGSVFNISNYKKTLRHELIHAALGESGLMNNAHPTENFAMDEEMVDWFAIQSPKLFKLYQEMNIL